MSRELLSADRVDEPLDRAGRDAVASELPSPVRRNARVRTVDFSRPTKFTTEQERRISRSLEAFCRAASTRMSAELRAPLDLELIGSSQLNWSNAHAAIPGEALCALADIQPHGTRMLLAVERPFVLQTIDLLLGGGFDVAPRERKLTEIDWAMAKHVLASLVSQLSIIWRDLAGVELALSALETHMETAQAAAVSEPTLSLTVEARMGSAATMMTFLLPHASVIGFVEAFAGDDRPHQAGRTDATQAAVSRVDVTLRAEVAALELTAAEVLALRPGDVVRFDGSPAGSVTVYADEVAICRARPGRSGRRRAIQVLDGEGA